MAAIHNTLFFCIDDSELPGNTRGIYVGLSIAFATVGLVGAGAQVLESRTAPSEGGRSMVSSDSNSRELSTRADKFVVLCLAVANCITCLGTIPLSALMISPCSNGSHCNVTYPAILLSIESLVIYGFAASATWTLAYAVLVLLKLRSADRRLTVCSFSRLRKVYLVLCWGLPLILTVASTLSVAVGVSLPDICNASGDRILWHKMAAYATTAVTVITIPFVFWQSARLSRRALVVAGRNTEKSRQMFCLLQIKFFSIVLTFVLCWLPNLVEFILQLTHCQTSWLFPLWALEACLNPLQGFFNLMLLSRRNIFYLCFRKGIFRRSGEVTPLLGSSGPSLSL